jgi:hypothetical protein
VSAPAPALRLARRLPLMAASLALAVGFWLFVAVREKVEVGILVPLDFEHTPSRLVIDNPPLEAYVRLRGPREQVESLDPQQLRVRVDVSAARADANYIQTLAASMIVVPRGVQVVGISPPAVNLRFIARARADEGGR